MHKISTYSEQTEQKQQLTLDNLAINTGEQQLDAVIIKNKKHVRNCRGGLCEIFDEMQQASISWDSLTLSVPYTNKKTGEVYTKNILNNISGKVSSGQMLCIMGPSGCGKTTLMNLLAKRSGSGGKTTQSGQIFINGQNHPQFWKWMRYVAQEDTLMGSLTVRETLMYSAEFNLKSSITSAQKKERISKVLEKLGLDVCAETYVGDLFHKGISGGQKKRLSIAIELISSPSIILLDEPTSGLDSSSAFEVMKLLVTLSEMGHTIICSIHQPSSDIWQMFDQLLLLSDGRQIYMGSAKDSLGYFQDVGYPCPVHVNPSDHFLRVINKDFEGHADIVQLDDQFKASKFFTAQKEDIKNQEISKYEDFKSTFLYKNGGWKQFITLFHRNNKNNIRNPGIFVVRLGMYAMLSFIIGFMYFNLGKKDVDVISRVSVLFYVQAFLVFMSIAALPFFMADRAIYQRETRNHYYQIFPYTLAQFIASLPGIFAIALVSSLLVVFPSGLQHFPIFLACMFVSLLVAEAFMAIVSSIVPHYIIGLAVASAVYGFFMLCEGMLIVRSKIPPYFIWGYYMGFHTYAYRVFMVNEFDNLQLKARMYPDGKAVLQFYDMDNCNIWEDIIILIGYACALQVLYYIILRFQKK